VSRKKDTAEFVDPIKWQLASIKSRFYTHTHTHTQLSQVKLELIEINKKL
jgi:hypothetical protein